MLSPLLLRRPSFYLLAAPLFLAGCSRPPSAPALAPPAAAVPAAVPAATPYVHGKLTSKEQIATGEPVPGTVPPIVSPTPKGEREAWANLSFSLGGSRPAPDQFDPQAIAAARALPPTGETFRVVIRAVFTFYDAAGKRLGPGGVAWPTPVLDNFWGLLDLPVRGGTNSDIFQRDVGAMAMALAPPSGGAARFTYHFTALVWLVNPAGAQMASRTFVSPESKPWPLGISRARAKEPHP